LDVMGKQILFLLGMEAINSILTLSKKTLLVDDDACWSGGQK
jgi:hypothetical protein